MRFFLSIIFFIFSLTKSSPAQEDQFSIVELDSLANVAYYEGDFVQSMHFSKKMIAKIKASKDQGRFLGNIRYVAELYLEMAKYEEAELLYLHVIDIQNKLKGKDNLLYIQCLGQLAYCYYGMGRYQEAEPFYLSALEIGKRVLVEQAPTYSSNLNNLALLYNTMGRNEEAEQLYLQVLQIDKQTEKAEYYYATSLNNLAGLYYEMKRYTEAEDLYRQAQAIRKKIYGDDHPFYALGLNNIAALYVQMDRHSQAEELYAQARRILGKESLHYLHSLNTSAKLLFNEERYQEAKLLWLEALKIAKQHWGTEHPGYAKYLDDLARLFLKTNHLETAFNYCFEGMAANSPQLDNFLFDLDSLDKFDYYSNEIIMQSLTTLLYIGQALYQQEQHKESLELHYKISKAAMRLNERIRNDFTSSSNKLRILAQNSEFVTNGINAAIELGDTDLHAEAFAFAEQNKSIILSDALKGQRARVLGDLPDSLVLQELALQQQKENLQQQQLQVTTDAEKAITARAINALNLEIDVFMESLKDKYPQYHSLKYENITAKAKEVQLLLKENTLLLEYFISEDITYLFVVSKKQVQLISINISKNRINQYVSDLRKAISNYSLIADSPKEAYLLFAKSADWLYKNILKKAIEDKQEKNLIIVTDGVLGHVPFEVFLVETPPQDLISYNKLHYLIKDYNISYSYSASLWKENLLQRNASKNKRRGGKQQQILAFAADYSKPSKNLLNLRSRSLYELRNSLEALPAVEGEVHALSKAFHGQFLKGELANEANFKQLAPHYGVIHLAMHGILEKKHPILSSLAFSENLDNTEDNFLQAYEISQLQLKADLVVLSACHTGYGKFEQGEGIISLARSFMYAGVPSLVVSLWQVNDQSTAIIMGFFYQNLAIGMNKSLALRKAKLKYLNSYNGMAAHPVFWSPFIQIGESRPIDLQNKSYWVFWLLGALVLLLFAVWALRR